MPLLVERRDHHRDGGCAITSALTPDDAPRGATDDAQVEPEALVAQVEELVLELLERLGLAPRVLVLHLRPSGESRPHEVPQAVERDLPDQLLDDLGLLGAGADHREVAAQDVDNLRQLVEVRAPQEPPNGVMRTSSSAVQSVAASSRCTGAWCGTSRSRTSRRSARSAAGGRGADRGWPTRLPSTTNGVTSASATRPHDASATSSSRLTRA